MSDPRALMDDAAARIVAGVEVAAARWVEGAVARILDAWGGLDAGDRGEAEAHARRLGAAATARVVGELGALFALPAAEQRRTPLEIVRTLRWEATEALRDAGVPEVERDAYDTAAFPDDAYGLVPRSIAELGDDLGGALLAWGIGKARVLQEG